MYDPLRVSAKIENPGHVLGWIKKVGKAILGDEILGRLDYYRFPQLAGSFGGPLNAQVKREAIVLELLGTFPFDLVVETGTFRGDTSEFLASHSNVPVLTVEYDARTYGYSRERLRRYPSVTTTKSDSRTFLLKLAEGGQLLARVPFFYLDAHWGCDLPLREELEIIYSYCPKSIVVIDDFQVPDDPQYGYDDYGEGKALTLGYIAPVVARFELAQFFPASPAAEETGRRRGCIVLAKDLKMIERIEAMSCLRRADTL